MHTIFPASSATEPAVAPRSRPARGRRLTTILTATVAVTGLIGGLATVCAPEASARNEVSRQAISQFIATHQTESRTTQGYQEPRHSEFEGSRGGSYGQSLGQNPAFANVGPDVKKALLRAGRYTRAEMSNIKNKCTRQYPNEPAGSNTLGICMLDAITKAHVPMINGQPWADRPVLTGAQMDSMDSTCKAQTATLAAYGTCVANSLNYFYGL